MKKLAIICVCAVLISIVICGCTHVGRHEVTFVAGDETIQVKTKQGVVEMPAPPQKDGFVFDGWYIVGGDNDGELFEKIYPDGKGIDCDVRVEAKWRLPQHTLKFYVEEELLTSVQVDHGTVFDSFPIPVREGYRFYGWCISMAENYLFDTSQEITSDSSLYAKFISLEPRDELIIVNIFGLNDESMIAHVLYGGTLTAPNEPIEIGRKVEGYYVDSNYQNRFDFAMPITHPFSLFVKWVDVSRLTVSFVTDTDEVIEPYSVKYNAKLLAPQQPYRFGYDFVGWYKANGVAFDFETDRITEDTVLFAYWDKIPQTKYIVTFVKNNGDADETLTFIDSDVVFPFLVKQNSDFAGWYWDKEFKKAYSSETDKPEVFSVYAKWRDKIRCGDYLIQQTVDETGFALLKYYGDEDDLIVPSIIDGNQIVEIGASCFYSTPVVTVSIPACIRTIGDKAFQYCNQLQELTFAPSSALERIGEMCFQNTALVLLRVPENVITIGQNAFSNTPLVNVFIEGSVELGDAVFDNCSSLTNLLVSKVTRIGVECFRRCKKLKEVDLGQCTTIDTRGFTECTALTRVSAPVCKYVWSNAFDRCFNLVEVEFPSLEVLGSQAFWYAGALQSCSIPRIKTIGQSAFGYCGALGLLELGADLENIGDNAFDHCSSIRFVFVEKNNRYGTCDGSIVSETTLIAAGNIQDGRYVIPENVETAEMFAFANGNAIRNLVIGEHFIDFQFSVLYLSNLQIISLDQNNEVFSIKDGNLYKDDCLIRFLNINTISRWEQAPGEKIGFGAFSGCEYLTEVQLHNNYSVVETGAFYRCFSLQTVSNAINVIEIQPFAFAECTDLHEIDLSPDVVIDEYAFYHSGMSKYDGDEG